MYNFPSTESKNLQKFHSSSLFGVVLEEIKYSLFLTRYFHYYFIIKIFSIFQEKFKIDLADQINRYFRMFSLFTFLIFKFNVCFKKITKINFKFLTPTMFKARILRLKSNQPYCLMFLVSSYPHSNSPTPKKIIILEVFESHFRATATF